MAPRVLISDALSPAAVQIFKDRGIEVDFQPNLGKDKDKLAEVVGNFDGLAIRSATKVTPKILEKAKSLKVIGRAGIGVDNVDIPAATAQRRHRDEHAVRQLDHHRRARDHADARAGAPDPARPTPPPSAGKWEKNKFMGVEITGKTLGVIGCGNIGSIVADRARRPAHAGDRLRSVPVAGARGRTGRARRSSSTNCSAAPISSRCTRRSPKRPRTSSMRRRSQKMKKGVRIVNCARGGLVDEAALARRARSAAMSRARPSTCSCEEPATANPLFDHPNVVCTPHLGAATTEAQENVALQIAEQMSDYLLRGAISNAVNFPSITAEEAPRLKPFIALAEKLGSFAGQLTETGISKVQIVYEGQVAQMKTKALTSAAHRRPAAADAAGRQRGVGADRRQGARHRGRGGDARRRRRLREPDHGHASTTERQTRSVSGTVFADGRPRIVNIKGIRMDAEFGPSMIYITNLDKPGFIGKFSSTLGDAGINIATFHVGREAPGGNAIALIEIDGELPADVLAKVRALPQVQSAKPLKF